MGSTLKVDNLQNSDGTRTIASDSGTAWSWGANAPAGMVIEQFLLPCNGSSITVQSGTYTSETITAEQLLDLTHTKIGGSLISYTPPTGSQIVIYEFGFSCAYTDASWIAHFGLHLDSDEVSDHRTTIENQGSSYGVHRVIIRYPFMIGGSADADSGRVASWTSAKTIQVKGREFSALYEARVHATGHWDAGASVFTVPVVGITAIA